MTANQAEIPLIIAIFLTGQWNWRMRRQLAEAYPLTEDQRVGARKKLLLSWALLLLSIFLFVALKTRQLNAIWRYEIEAAVALLLVSGMWRTDDALGKQLFRRNDLIERQFDVVEFFGSRASMLSQIALYGGLTPAMGYIAVNLWWARESIDAKILLIATGWLFPLLALLMLRALARLVYPDHLTLGSNGFTIYRFGRSVSYPWAAFHEPSLVPVYLKGATVYEVELAFSRGTRLPLRIKTYEFAGTPEAIYAAILRSFQGHTSNPSGPTRPQASPDRTFGRRRITDGT